jgi:hypothetical protein
MATINNEDLQEVFGYVATIENIIQKEVSTINGNKSHVDKIVPDNLRNIYSAKEKKAKEFADNLSRQSYEALLISLVSTFERVVFAKYKTTYGEIKKIAENHTPKSIDYYKSRQDFVEGSIDKLHKIIILMGKQISPSSLQILNDIKDHRDFIAHGKRFGKEPPVKMKLEEIALALDKIITEIEK